jgi:hypothetical protein
LVKRADHKAPHYAVFSTPMLPHASQAQTYSSHHILRTHPQPLKPH